MPSGYGYKGGIFILLLYLWKALQVLCPGAGGWGPRR